MDQLNHMGVDYEYVDVDQNPEASEWVRRHNNGKEIKPTIDVDGQILSEPSDAELEEAVA